MILWNGYCHVHHNITEEKVKEARNENPDAKIIVHPECKHEIVKMCDGAGSTTYLIKAVENSDKNTKWVIGTEYNLVQRLKEKFTDRDIKILDVESVCTNMNKTTLENLCEILEDILKGDYSKQITVDRQTAEEAVKALDTMLSLS